MAEETKKTTTRGRKPKAKTETPKVDTTDIELESKDDKDMIAKLMEQMAILQKQVEDSKKEKTDLQQLVEALKSTPTEKKESNLPKRIKVVSLIPNIYNLTTQPNGKGMAYTFEGIGDAKQIKTSDLEDILSISGYRKQAEDGYFYITNKDFLEEQGLDMKYTQDVIEGITTLANDESVNVFCELDSDMQESISVKIAENLNSGMRIDRNRLYDIQRRTDIDIEKMAQTLQKTSK